MGWSMTMVICSLMHPGLVAGFGLLLAHAAWESHFSGWLRLLRSARNDKARIEVGMYPLALWQQQS